MHQTYKRKIIKHWWKKSKTKIKGEAFYVHRWVDSVLLRHQFLPTWCIDSTQFQQKSKQIILWILKKYLKADMERQKIANTILQEKNKVGDWHYLTSRLTTQL